MPIRLAITGAAGRTGRRIVALAAADAQFHTVATMEAVGSRAIGSDAGELAGIGRIGVPITDQCPAEFDVLIDFSLPHGTAQWLDLCRRARRPIVIGTTGHDDAQMQRIRAAAREIAVLKAPNMSVGVNVLLRLARELGETLDASYDVEITEAHHRFKADAPSGTALALAEAVKEGRRAADAKGLLQCPVAPASRRWEHRRDACATGEPERCANDQPLVFGRQGQTGQRPAGQIGMHSLRLGDTVGEHAVSFGTLGETVTISHSAHSRDTFAAGALCAAKWIFGKAPGSYDMQNVLFHV